MKAFKKRLKRRDFLEYLAIAGFGGASGLHFNLPLRNKETAKEALSLKEQPLNSPKADKMSFHVFSKHLQFLGYEEMAEVAAEIGFDGVDLSVRPGGHVLPEKVEQDLPGAVAAIRSQGLEASMMTTALTDATDETNRKVLETASKHGLCYYRTDWLWYEDEKEIKENLARFKQILGSLGQLNRELNIVGDYQNHAGFNGYPFGASVWDLAEVLDEIDNPYLGCQYDIRHATVEGGTSWPLGLKRIHPHINSLVMKDFKWGEIEGQWQVINTPIGRGMVDFPKYFALLKAHNISAPASIHFEYEMPEHQKNLSQKELRKQTIQLMQQDLNTLKAYRKEAGLG